MKFKSTLLIIAPLILVGCALLGPDYKKPVTATPDTWAHSESATTTNTESAYSVNLSDVSWWQKFNDPVLNNLIESALDNNSNLQVAVANIAIAQSQLKQVHLSWVPTIALGGSAGVGQAANLSGIPSFTPGQSAPSTTDFNFYQAGLVPVYSVNIFKLIKQSDVAKFNINAARAAKDSVRLTIISQITGSYFSLLALHEELDQQKAIVADLEELVKLSKIQYKNGLVALTDIQSYEQQLRNVEINIPPIEDNIVHTQNALQVLLGRNPGDIEVKTKFADVDLTGKIPVNTPSVVLRNRPDIISSEEQLKAANANIGVATSNYFPNITLTTPVGGFSSQLTGLFNPAGDFWTTQIAATIPILNLSLSQIVKQSKGHYYIAYYNYIQTVKGAFAEVDNSLSTYAKTQDSYNSALKLADVINSNADLNKKNYELGYTSYPELLPSKISADSAKTTITQIRLQQIQSIISVYQAMAGGYNYKNTEDTKTIDEDHDLK